MNQSIFSSLDHFLLQQNLDVRDAQFSFQTDNPRDWSLIWTTVSIIILSIIIWRLHRNYRTLSAVIVLMNQNTPVSAQNLLLRYTPSSTTDSPPIINRAIEFLANELFVNILILIVLMAIFVCLIIAIYRLPQSTSSHSILCLEVGNDDESIIIDWKKLIHPGESYGLTLSSAGPVALEVIYFMFKTRVSLINLHVTLNDVRTGCFFDVPISLVINRFKLTRLSSVLARRHYITLYVKNPDNSVSELQLIKEFIAEPPALYSVLAGQSQRSINQIATPYEVTPV